MDKYGDFKVGRTISAGRRVNEGATALTLTAARNLDLHEYGWLRASAASTQDIVLPDATTLDMSWGVVVDVPDSSGASINVKTYHGTTPVLKRNIVPGRAYRFTCVDTSTEAGLWKVDFLEEADKIPSERYVHSFNATTDWGDVSGGYFYITVTAATHGRGAQPSVSVREIVGTEHIQVSPDRLVVEDSGNVVIRVPADPNLKFAGEMLFI